MKSCQPGLTDVLILIGMIACAPVWAPPAAARQAVQSADLVGVLEEPAATGSSKVWVYFTDHGERDASDLLKMLAEVSLTERSLERRARRSRLQPADTYDLPVCEAYIDALRALDCRIRHSSKYLNAASVVAAPDQIRLLAALPFVRRIERVHTASRPLPGHLEFPQSEKGALGTAPGPQPDRPWRAALADSTFYGLSYFQVEQIDVPPLHNLGYHGEKILIAMLDTGFRRIHEGLTHVHVVSEWDFINNDPITSQEPGDPAYQDMHGSLSLGTIAAYWPGAVIGPAWAADFLLAKTERYNRELQVEEDDWVRALEWADSLGADIVSSSVGYFTWYRYPDMDGDTAVTTRAADIAASRGILVVAAAGNEGPLPWPGIIAPADGDSVIAVGAADSTGEAVYFSSRGPTYDGRIKPDVLAMGLLAASVRWNDTTGVWPFNGTSSATPLVAGACALILQMNPDWSPMDVRAALWATSGHSEDPNNDHGWGIVDTYRAARLHSAIPVVFELVPGSCDHPFNPKSQGLVPTVVFGSRDFDVRNIDASSLRVLERAAPVRIQGIDAGAAGAVVRGMGGAGGGPPCPPGAPDGIDDLMIFFAVPDIASALPPSEKGDVVTLELTGNLYDGAAIEGNATVRIVGNQEAAGAVPSRDGPLDGGATRSTSLGDAVPNPFNPVTRISYTLAHDGDVRLAIYDVAGRLVERLVNGPRPAGHHVATWNARGRPSGVYFYRLETESFSATRKLVILK
jgi:hypothetical protein